MSFGISRLFLLLYIGFILGCGKNESRNVPSDPPKKVKVITIESIQTDSSERIPGNVRPAIDSTIAAKMSGRILKFLVNEGDLVKSGQSLVEIDAHEIQAKLDQAVASQRQSQQDLKRAAQLLPRGAIPQQQYDEVEARAKIAEASVAEAMAMVGYAKIEAPYDGIVTQKIAQEGDLAIPGKPLLMIEKQDLYRFEVDIPETISSGIKIGDSLRISLAGLELSIDGTIAEISPTTDSSSRTRHVKLDLPSNPVFRSGQFGYILVPIQRRPEIRIPLSALVERGQIESVFVVKDGITYLRLVRSGKRGIEGVQILSGLQDGERIVSADTASLTDAQRVEVMP